MDRRVINVAIQLDRKEGKLAVARLGTWCWQACLLVMDAVGFAVY
jgi:hypothetical protein